MNRLAQRTLIIAALVAAYFANGAIFIAGCTDRIRVRGPRCQPELGGLIADALLAVLAGLIAYWGWKRLRAGR